MDRERDREIKENTKKRVRTEKRGREKNSEGRDIHRKGQRKEREEREKIEKREKRRRRERRYGEER